MILTIYSRVLYLNIYSLVLPSSCSITSKYIYQIKEMGFYNIRESCITEVNEMWLWIGDFLIGRSFPVKTLVFSPGQNPPPLRFSQWRPDWFSLCQAGCFQSPFHPLNIKARLLGDTLFSWKVLILLRIIILQYIFSRLLHYISWKIVEEGYHGNAIVKCL